ncbi:MAG: lipopolysaccharide heptosyltransferase II [Candidatus Solibacter usitatus]|nr:lipopolysaccharide heptosyltransferase II [Candidatus Solibacter usitatus]
MSLAAIRAIRARYPQAHIAILARPWVGDLYSRETCINRVIPYLPAGGAKDFAAKWRLAATLRREQFDCAILLQNAFEAAAVARLAGIPCRIGYARDGRGWLLTHAIPVPRAGEIPRHERFYYLELLRRAGIVDEIPPVPAIQLEGADAAAREGAQRFERLGIPPRAIGVSPGAAYGGAKRWLSERFAQTARRLQEAQGGSVVLFGSVDELPLCETVAESIRAAGSDVWNLAGQTSLGEFIQLAAACRVFLTNDSGAMHIASALGVPTVAVFGATDDSTTGPTGEYARVVRQPVECSPCLLRECPIDHRCMTGVTVERVAEESLVLLRSRYGHT